MRPLLHSITKTLLAGLVLSTLTLAASAQTIRIRADVWMPFNGDPTATQPGFAVELAKAIFEPQGIKIDYQVMPWVDALGACRSAKIEAVIGAGPSDLEGLIAPQESIGEPRVVLLVAKKNTWTFENLHSLSSVKLGVIDGYTYWDSFDEYVKKNAGPKIVVFKGDSPLVDEIKQLKAGQIDCFAEMLTVYAWTMKSSGLSPSDFKIAYTHEGDPLYFAFAKTPEGTQYAGLFDQGIRALRSSGKLAALLKTYGMVDWK
jgi:polar amino acid transport system substrate-binding protein